MKKLIATLSLCFLLLSFAKAQFVTIPDANFRAFLKTSYPSAFNANDEMDTSSILIKSADSIHYNREANDLSGIEYFTSLKYLSIDEKTAGGILINYDINIPTKLSNTIVELRLIRNYSKGELNIAFPLPNNLKVLKLTNLRFNSSFVSGSWVSSMFNLPNSLEYLQSDICELTSLPTLPNGLKYLFVNNNNFSSLNISNTQIIDFFDCTSSYPNGLVLPSTLKRLSLGPAILNNVGFPTNNPLGYNCAGVNPQPAHYTNFPTLPPNLTFLNVYAYYDFTLQTNLPNTIDTLILTSPLGNGINMKGTFTKLPDSLKLFELKFDSIYCLPMLPSKIKTLYVDNTIIKCLPNKPSSLTTSLQVCNATNNPNNCPTFGPPANYVNIPDTNFGKFLIGKYPTCLYKDASNLYWMDTTNSLIVNETSFPYISSLPIYYVKNLDGIQYFKNLQTLVVDNLGDSLINIPQFPKKLKFFMCTYCPLIKVYPSFPSSIRDIDIKNNFSLVSLPTFPKELRTLNLSEDTSLVVLPNIPDSLTALYVDLTKIRCFPSKLPNTLQTLMGNSLMTCYPNIPTSISFITPNLPICNPTNNPNQCYIYPSVSGKVFTDNNSNATKDANEFYRPLVKFSINNGQNSYSNMQGVFGISVDTFGTYTLKATAPPYYKIVPDSVVVTFTQGSPSVVLPDFALQPIAVVDSYLIKTTGLNAPRPGFAYAVNVSYGNVGTVSAATNNLVLFNYDTSKFTFDSASVPVTHYTSNNAPVVFNAGSLVAGQGGSFNVYLKLKTTVPLGTLVKTFSTITYNTSKSIDADSAVVIGSYDPNDKLATPQLTPLQVVTGTPIDYTIRFQNTGTASAINIVISDTLSSLLQYNQIQVLATSHNSKISYRLGNGIIYFEFLGINLPDSNTNEPLSHGFVSFRIKPLNTLAPGTIVENKAHIYFDYNSPIITNTAQTIIKTIITPVRIISYAVHYNKAKEVSHKWFVGVEENLSHYTIERSIDGYAFEAIGKLTAQALNKYEFIDKLTTNVLQQGTIYYRLKMVDKDGKYAYSEVKKLSLYNVTQGIKIYPNPSKGNVTIDVVDVKEIGIYNYLGKQVAKQNFNLISTQYNTQLLKGIYVVKAILANGEVKTEKLIVE